jgi:hypothetical protein
MADTTAFVCQTCKRVLDYAPGFGWVHGQSDAREWEKAPHAPVPVHPSELTDIEYHCDFCFAYRPEYVVPAKSFDTDAQGRSVGDWMACEACAQLVREARWEDLTVRAVEAFSARHGGVLPKEVGRVLARTYIKLKSNMTGPVRKR